MSARPSRAPAAVLLLLAPIVGELLNGATRLSFIFALLPQIMVWGCGALLIREATSRWQGRWASSLVLAAALSIWVEFFVLQTSLTPLPWLALAPLGAWGVNWLWFMFMLGYEAVWIVLLPILITELIFADRRREAWLGPRGIAVAAFAFLLGSWMLWFLWTRIAVPQIFHMARFDPPLPTLLMGLLAILGLVLAAYALRTVSEGPPAAVRRTPSPWVVGVSAAALALPWWLLIALVFAPQPSLPLWLVLFGGSAWATAVFLVVRRWATSPGWNDRCRWALSFGALLVCMLAGYLGSSLWPMIDLVGKAVLNAIAVVLMAALARAIWRREAPRDGSSVPGLGATG